jgi:hypothetical protein
MIPINSVVNTHVQSYKDYVCLICSNAHMHSRRESDVPNSFESP